ncbi:MAG: Gmad2 immunoglobulin-like domain-containing protein [Candidatus Gracilibacteria bacterium]|jgi:hypothetical protein
MIRRKFIFIFTVILLFVFSACVFESTHPEEIESPVPSDGGIRVSKPLQSEVSECPLSIHGEARGGWFFEGSFPVKLVDSSGDLIAQSKVIAGGEWMTEDYVPFDGEISFVTDASEGTVVFEKDNPSGLPENSGEFSVPVSFESCSEEEVVKAYIEENIGDLSYMPPVLGGTWYTVSVDFLEGQKVYVVYEDGHIQRSFTAEYAVTGDGGVSLGNITEEEIVSSWVTVRRSCESEDCWERKVEFVDPNGEPYPVGDDGEFNADGGLYVYRDSLSNEIRLYNFETRIETTLMTLLEGVWSSFVWSPDQTKIAMVAVDNGENESYRETGGTKLFVLTLDKNGGVAQKDVYLLRIKYGCDDRWCNSDASADFYFEDDDTLIYYTWEDDPYAERTEEFKMVLELK